MIDFAVVLYTLFEVDGVMEVLESSPVPFIVTRMKDAECKVLTEDWGL